MQKHTKIYYNYFCYDETDYVGCEICNAPAVDIHHIEIKGMGGSKLRDFIDNLIAVCRSCHTKCHSSKEFNKKAKEIHLNNL